MPPGLDWAGPEDSGSSDGGLAAVADRKMKGCGHLVADRAVWTLLVVVLALTAESNFWLRTLANKPPCCQEHESPEEKSDNNSGKKPPSGRQFSALFFVALVLALLLPVLHS
jgi:hypothetical protein